MPSNVRLPEVSPIRQIINKLAMGHNLDQAIKAGDGTVYLVPSSSDPGSFYVVTRVKHGRKFVWLCGCKGFRFSEEDKCRHVTNIMNLTTRKEVKRGAKTAK